MKELAIGISAAAIVIGVGYWAGTVKTEIRLLRDDICERLERVERKVFNGSH